MEHLQLRIEWFLIIFSCNSVSIYSKRILVTPVVSGDSKHTLPSTSSNLAVFVTVITFILPLGAAAAPSCGAVLSLVLGGGHTETRQSGKSSRIICEG